MPFSPMAKKKLILEQDDSVGFSLLAISSTLKDYKLTFHLNKLFNINLRKIEDFQPILQDQTYPFYLHDRESSPYRISLLKTKNSGNMLLKGLKQADYLFIVHYDLPAGQLKDYLKKIKTIPNVMTSYEIKTGENKLLAQLLNDLEIHILENDKMAG